MAESQGGGAHTLTLDEQRAAEKAMRQAAADGRFDDAELSRRLGLVYKATTPFELWKATDGIAGDPHRADTKEWAKPIGFFLLVIPATVIVLAVIIWLIVRAAT